MEDLLGEVGEEEDLAEADCVELDEADFYIRHTIMDMRISVIDS